MGKKKKKKSDDKPKLFKKKHKRFLRNLVILVVVGGSALVLWKPELVQDDTQRARVESMRESVLGVSTQGQDKLVEKFSTLKKVESVSKKVPGQVTIGEKEIYVDDVVKAVSSQLEDLPAEQYQKFKSNFCADLVATASATPE